MADPAPSERSPAPNDTAPRPAGLQRPAGQRPGGQPSTDRPSGLRRITGRSTPERTAWRVEGGPGGDRQSQPRRSPFGGRGFWLALLVLLLLNFVISTLIMAPAARTEVPYTLFRTEVGNGNVPSITAVEDQITGEFKTPVRYPAG